MEKDADLTTTRGHTWPAEGKIIHLMGRVLDLKGEPVKRARVEIWQTFFPGEALNEKDPLFQMLGKDSPLAMGRILPATPEAEPDSLMVIWDIILYQR